MIYFIPKGMRRKMEQIEFSPIQKNLLDALKKQGAMTRDDIMEVLDYPRTTVFNNLTKLQILEKIGKASYHPGGRGRPLVYFFLEEDRHMYMTKIKKAFEKTKEEFKLWK